MEFKTITLNNLVTSTEQEVFDFVAHHLLTQNKKSEIITSSGTSSCKYRTESGLKCAVGCFITDEEYKHKFEGMGWPELLAEKEVPEEHYELIVELQDIHDDSDVFDWESRLQYTCSRFGLQWKFNNFSVN